MMATLGAKLVSVERGRVELTVPHDERFTQQHGFVHAGAVAAVLDSACGYAAFSVMPPEAAVLTASYTINLLAPAVGGGSACWPRWSGRAGPWWSAEATPSPATPPLRSRSCRQP